MNTMMLLRRWCCMLTDCLPQCRCRWSCCSCMGPKTCPLTPAPTRTWNTDMTRSLPQTLACTACATPVHTPRPARQHLATMHLRQHLGQQRRSAAHQRAPPAVRVSQRPARRPRAATQDRPARAAAATQCSFCYGSVRGLLSWLCWRMCRCASTASTSAAAGCSARASSKARSARGRTLQEP